MAKDRKGNDVSQRTPEQIQEEILKALQRVGERFARDPTPTDGSVQSGLREKRRRTADTEQQGDKKTAEGCT